MLETLQASRATLESGFDPQLIAQQKALEQQLNLKEKSQADLLSRQQDASDVAAELQQLNQQYEQVKATMAVGNPRFVALTQPRPLNREDILRLAPDDETALFEYSLGEKQSYLWVVTKAGFAHYVLPGRARIEESAAKLHNLLRWPENGGAQRETELRAAIKDLSQLVLHPAAANLRPRLALVTDGVLGFIPFQVLATAERPSE